MGVINVTPDSFSDGGAYLDPGAAVALAHQLAADGAAIIDLGAESTRPGAKGVALQDEWRRLEPVLTRLRQDPPAAALSVDTAKPEIMLRAADAGVTWINDVAGQAQPEVLARLAAYPQMGYIAMHMPFTPDIMQTAPQAPAAALTAVAAFFEERQASARQAGLAASRLWLDPGIGFGKTDAANVQLMAAVKTWSQRYQIAIGISRKSLLGRTLDLAQPKDRDPPSKTLELGLAMLGARLIRTHAVRPLRRLLDLLDEGQDA